MKKAISIMAAILVTAILITGCQSTPEQPVVIQKDMEQMLEKAQDDESGTKVSELEAPKQEHYTFSTSAADGRLTIDVDAPVIIPGGALPTVKVGEGSFTQEQVTGFFNYIFPNGGAYSYGFGEQVLTKKQIEELILTYKQYIADGTVSENTLYTEEELLEEIASLEKQYAVAPETAKENPLSDGTMQRRTTTYGYMDANGKQAYREVAVNQLGSHRRQNDVQRDGAGGDGNGLPGIPHYKPDGRRLYSRQLHRKQRPKGERGRCLCRRGEIGNVLW